MSIPHPPLKPYYEHESERRAWVLDIFQRTAGDYDRIERMMALGTGSWYRRSALTAAGLRPGMTVLDIGSGTGLVTCEAVRIVGDPERVIGVDPCLGMIDKARVPPGVRLLAGSAESIPVCDGHADFVSMGYALRHVSDLSVTFQEFRRVLKPGGRLCLLEITRPDNGCRRLMLKAYMRGLIPVLARLMAHSRNTPMLMRYYWDTIETCIAPTEILTALQGAGFVEARRRVTLGIFSEYHATNPLIARQPR